MSPANVASLLLVVAAFAGATPMWAQDPIPESEPNDSPGTADTAFPGGRIAGVKNTSEDTDYWVINNVRVGDTIYADVDANEFHSSLVPYISLYAADGVTRLASGADWDGLDPYLVYVAPRSGRY